MYKKQIEVEVRGHLGKKSFDAIIKRLKQKGAFLGNYNRLLIDYSTTKATTLSDIKNRAKDVRLRITNNHPELIVKIGEFAGRGREEVSVMLEPGEFAKAMRFMFLLGYKQGLVAVRKIRRFDYKGVEISVVEVVKIDKNMKLSYGNSFFYEADMTVPEDKMGLAEEKIAFAVKELNLDVFSEYAKISKLKELGVKISKESFYSYVQMLNMGANLVVDTERVDLSKVIEKLSYKNKPKARPA